MLRAWIAALLRQRGPQFAAAYSGVAVAITLVALIGVFSIMGARTMTARALDQVPVDWQVAPRRSSDSAAIERTIRALPDVRVVERVGYAAVSSFETNRQGATQATGAGLVLGLSPSYLATFPGQARMLLGQADGVILAQQTAANLHAGIGDTVRLVRPSGTVELQVGGIAELPSSPSLLQNVGAPATQTPMYPTDNVLMIPLSQWDTIFGVPGATSAISTAQFHVSFDRSNFPTSPEIAYSDAGQRARNFEVQTAGQAILADNLAARLDAVRVDAIYARVLFLFLGLPAIVISLLLTIALITSDADRRRSNDALMRMRGFERGALLRLIVLEEALGAVGAAVVGSTVSILIVALSFGVEALDVSSFVWISVSAALGIVASLLCGIIPALRRLQTQSIKDGRTLLAKNTVPLWQKLWLDIAMIVVAAVIFWKSAAANYQVVLAPEGVVATAVDYTAFLAPLCLWTGTVLLTLRLASSSIGRGAGAIEKSIEKVVSSRSLAPIVGASLSRQKRRIAAGVALAALAFSFAFATAIFNRTYEEQAGVDATLTNGADVAITSGAITSGEGHSVQPLIAHVRTMAGVADVALMQHRFAYVGNDLQDLYGIDPSTIRLATTLADSYFSSGDATGAMAALEATPDGVLVSQETVNDFRLALGDKLNLRLKDKKTGAYETIKFHLVGIVKEFPTAPKDSFLIANSTYVAEATNDTDTNIMLVRTSGQPGDVAAELRRDLGASTPFSVSDIGSATRLIASSLTALDLGRLTTIELGFAGLLLAASTGVVLALGFRERRHSSEILEALGASREEISTFLWTEAAIVLGMGALTGVVIGVAVAAMLVKLLSGIFDPPPDALSYPVLQLLFFALIGIIATLVAVGVQRKPRSSIPRL